MGAARNVSVGRTADLQPDPVIGGTPAHLDIITELEPVDHSRRAGQGGNGRA